MAMLKQALKTALNVRTKSYGGWGNWWYLYSQL